MPTPREMMEAARRNPHEGELARAQQQADYLETVMGRRSSSDSAGQDSKGQERDDSSHGQTGGRHAANASPREDSRGLRDEGARGSHAAGVPGGRPPRARSSRMRRHVTQWRMYGVIAFSALMIVGGIVGLLFFARPTTSAVEMRNLTEYPEFTVESFLDGSYFTQVSLWYADTYPLREPMVAADHAIHSLFGINTGSGMVGGNVQADEIPVEQSDEQPQVVQVEPLAEAPDERVVAADIQANIMSGVYVHDGAGYAIYYFSQHAADTYITAMNKAAERLEGTSTVYSIMAPANSITLSDEEQLAVGGSDQQQTLDYLRTRFNSNVHSVEIVDDIIAHRDEYLYFYTDHHWTQVGAYYAYVAFCEQKGIEPKSLTSRRQVDLGDFQGTYYDTIASMGYVRPDTITGYAPNGTNDMAYWSAYGEEVQGKVVNEEAASWEPSYKYSGFIAGDQPLEIIKNPQITDGSSCLVVKDSYGCAFVPLLVDNYETVYVIDFRETDKNICDYAIENNIQDVIFMTGMKIGLTDTVAQTLLAEVS